MTVPPAQGATTRPWALHPDRALPSESGVRAIARELLRSTQASFRIPRRWR